MCDLGNHQMCRLGQQQRSLYCPFDLPVRYHRGDLFEHVHHVQVGLLRLRFVFNFKKS